MSNETGAGAAAQGSGRGAGRAALAFIFVTVALDMLALGSIIPVLPRLVESFLSGETASAALVYGLFGTVFALMQFIFSPVLGAISDAYGRRPVVLLSNLGLGLDYVLMALAPNLIWLFVGRTIAGITSASISTATAYIADVTPKEKRAGAFGLLGAAFGLGFILGPALGGLLGSIDPRLPFWLAAGLSLANAAYGFFVLPESLPRERRTPFALRSANPLGALRLLASHPYLLPLAGANFLSVLAHEVLPSTTVLAVGFRYAWGEMAVGLFLAGVGLASSIVQALLVKPAVERFGEWRVLLTGLGFGVLGFAIYGLAPTGAYFWMGVPVVALWGLAGPASQGLMTARVGPDEQGQLQGAIASLRGIAGLIGPGLFTMTFAGFIGALKGLELSGAPFLLASLLLLVAAIVVWRTSRAAAQSSGST